VDTRVYILWSHQMFYEAVSALLNHPGVEIVGDAPDSPRALAGIEALQPDTIVVEEADDNLDEEPAALRILEACSWNPRVVRLSLSDNELRLYQREQWTVEQARDLYLFIQGKQPK
jgi:chemotaxis response regulator CheB